MATTTTDHKHGHQMPEHLAALEHTNTVIDVVQVTSKTPYKEVNFIGTYCAICFGTCGAYAGFVMPATSLAIINSDIDAGTDVLLGPSPNLTWVALAWTLTLSIGYTIVGRLSDIFGRRYFFAASSAFATIGCIVGVTAQNINQLIGASVLLGLGAAGQLSFNYALGELVPVRHRFPAGGLVFIISFPFAGLGPFIARLFIVHTSVSWRGSYYLSLAINALSTICWVIWYHPPDFEHLHVGRTKMQELREMDFGGLFLFTAGSLLFLLGLSWGGSSYPWNSSYVIGTLVVGICTIIAFVFYEIYMPIRRPLIPMRLFKNYNFNVITILAIVGGMLYYSLNVIFPTLISTLYTTDIVQGGLISCSIGGGVCCGEFLGSLLAVPGGHLKYKLMFVTAGMVGFIGAVAAAGSDQAIGTALVTSGSIMVGFLEIVLATVVTIVVDDQSEMGTAAGVFGSLRSAGGVLATAIYVAILDNRIASDTKSLVVPAIVNAGLQTSSIEPFLLAFASGNVTDIENVPGVSIKIITAAKEAFTATYEDSFRLVFLASIAFGVVAFIASCFFREIEDRLSHDIIRRLDVRGQTDEESLEKKEVDHVEESADKGLS